MLASAFVTSAIIRRPEGQGDYLLIWQADWMKTGLCVILLLHGQEATTEKLVI